MTFACGHGRFAATIAIGRSVRSVIHTSALGLVVALAGCGATPPQLPATGGDTQAGDSTSGGGGETTREGSTSTGDTTVDGSGSSDGPTDDGDSGTDDGGTEVGCGSSPQRCDAPSAYTGVGDCDPYAQDCPDGYKCSPTVLMDFSTACVPVVVGALGPGEPCQSTGRPGDGMDDCDVGLTCSAGASLSPVCTPLCGCGPLAPTCPPNALCSIANTGTAPVCAPTCDPLVQGCAPGSGCYPLSDGVAFLCLPDGTVFGRTNAGDACMALNECSPGQVCSAFLPISVCADPNGCCTALCDTSDPTACTGTGANCVPWWPADDAPADCSPTIGFCNAV
jgi:hypothetical protein